MGRIILILILALTLFTYAVFEAVSGYTANPPTEGWEPPSISQCDKPLWERIT
ncbi:hypothetical protein LCGC14_3165920, partial [marine sediment metagenome]